MGTRRAVVLGVAILSLACIASCETRKEERVRGSGRTVTTTHRVKGFTGVAFSTFGTLHIEKGDRESLRIEAEENLQRHIEVDVSGKVLRIGIRDRFTLHPTRPVDFYLTVKRLDTIRLSGSGDVVAPDLQSKHFSLDVSGSGEVEIASLETESVEIQVSGSGGVDVEAIKTGEQNVSVSGSSGVRIGRLEARRLDVRITGSGDVEVSDGKVETEHIALSGSGDYSARRLESSKAKVNVSGTGSATVHVEDRLEAVVSGSGSVRYVGEPKVSSTVTGSGTVHRM